MGKTKELTKAQPKEIKSRKQNMTTDNLLQMAINKDLDIQKLEKLIELKTKEEERFYKRDFDFNFALMQKDFLPAQKNKDVHSSKGELLYSYCPLENILKVYQPIISKHGFSYRWSEESIKEGKEIRVWCIVSGYGHEERTSVDIPIMPGNSFTNAVQQRGSTSTYGKRYSFTDAFGIILEEDDDGKDAGKTEEVSEDVTIGKPLSIKPAQEVAKGESKTTDKATPEICNAFINKLSNTTLKIEFAKRLNIIRSKYKGSGDLLAILIKNIKDEKRHSSASFLTELDTELREKAGVAG